MLNYEKGTFETQSYGGLSGILAIVCVRAREKCSKSWELVKYNFNPMR